MLRGRDYSVRWDLHEQRLAEICTAQVAIGPTVQYTAAAGVHDNPQLAPRVRLLDREERLTLSFSDLEVTLSRHPSALNRYCRRNVAARATKPCLPLRAAADRKQKCALAGPSRPADSVS